jgi:hypothetical protein
MAPFSIKCLSCGEYIGKGRTFNSRKEVRRGENYLGIQIFHFSINCTRCSAPIVFRTDPKNGEYAMASGAVRNAEPWRDARVATETDEQRLNRLEAEGQQEHEGEGAHDAMQNLEHRAYDGETEMAVADALDQIQLQNAVRARASMKEREATVNEAQEEQERQDSEEARMAFAKHRSEPALEAPVEQDHDEAPPSLTKPSTRPAKKQKDYAAALGIKSKKT